MSKRPAPKDTLSDVLTRLELELAALNEVTQRGASQKARRSAEKGLAALISRAEDLRKQLDPPLTRNWFLIRRSRVSSHG